MFDKHVPDPIFERLRRLFLGRQLPVRIEVEGELGQYSELALDLNPARTADKAPRVIPVTIL